MGDDVCQLCLSPIRYSEAAYRWEHQHMDAFNHPVLLQDGTPPGLLGVTPEEEAAAIHSILNGVSHG